MDALKKGALFAIGFLGMIGAVSLALSAYVYVTDSPATASSWSTLSSVEWNKMVTALQNLDQGIQKAACEGRRGVWSGWACQEYAYYGTTVCNYGSCTCDAGYHKCTFPDLFSGGLESLRRPWYNLPASAAYGWVAGSYLTEQDSFFYPWVYGGDPLTCTTGSHYMMDLRRNSGGNTAWGCYADSYNSATVLCCRDNQ